MLTNNTLDGEKYRELWFFSFVFSYICRISRKLFAIWFSESFHISSLFPATALVQMTIISQLEYYVVSLVSILVVVLSSPHTAASVFLPKAELFPTCFKFSICSTLFWEWNPVPWPAGLTWLGQGTATGDGSLLPKHTACSPEGFYIGGSLCLESSRQHLCTAGSCSPAQVPVWESPSQGHLLWTTFEK